MSLCYSKRLCQRFCELLYFGKDRELFVTEVGSSHINSVCAPPPPLVHFFFSPIVKTWPCKQPYRFEPMERYPQSHREQRFCLLVDFGFACSMCRVKVSMLPLGELVSPDTISSPVSIFRCFSKVGRFSRSNLFSQYNLIYWNLKTEVLGDHCQSVWPRVRAALREDIAWWLSICAWRSQSKLSFL